MDKEFLHCHVIVNNGDGYVLMELTSNGIDYRTMPAKKPMTIIRNVKRLDTLIAAVCIWRDKPPKMKWRPLAIRSCNELSRFAAGVDIGFTFNPIHLYRKLLKYDGKRNFTVLHHWRR